MDNLFYEARIFNGSFRSVYYFKTREQAQLFKEFYEKKWPSSSVQIIYHHFTITF
jgi:hypothetical protein